jgi:hypothetical protein
MEGDSISVIENAKKKIRAGLELISGLGSATYFNEVNLVGC